MQKHYQPPFQWNILGKSSHAVLGISTDQNNTRIWSFLNQQRPLSASETEISYNSYDTEAAWLRLSMNYIILFHKWSHDAEQILLLATVF